MDLKKRYYDYAKNHTEEELWQLFNEDLKNNVNSGSDYFSCEDFVRLVKKVYDRKYVLSDSQMLKIEADFGKYLVYYADLVTDMNYITHKQKVIMTFVFLISCRNTGNEKFFMSNERLMKLANEYRFQYLAQRFFNQNVPFNRVADEYLHYVNW